MIFNFAYGGDTVQASQIIIYDYNTNEIIYSSPPVMSQKYQFILTKEDISKIPELKNGNIYKVALYVYVQDPNSAEVGRLIASDLSDKILLRCYTTPKLSFVGLPYDKIIYKSSYTFQLKYEQPENELLSKYRLILYNTNGTINQETGWISNNELTATLNGLLPEEIDETDLATYYIYAECYTVYDTFVKTEKIPLYVKYRSTEQRNKISAENIFLDGIIRIYTNLDVLVGIPNKEPVNYIDYEKADLRDGTVVTFDDNKVHIDEDFYIKLIGSDFVNEKEILILNYGKIKIFYLQKAFRNYKGELMDETGSFYLIADDGKYTFVAESNKISAPSPGEELFLMIQKKKNEFYLQLDRLSNVS